MLVITGRDKGKKGTILEIIPDKDLVKVAGIAIVTKHLKARKQGETSTIKKQEGYIHASNVMLISTDKKPCRVNFKVMENGKKVRLCNRTKDVID